jgi:hypothetical protein
VGYRVLLAATDSNQVRAGENKTYEIFQQSLDSLLRRLTNRHGLLE